MKSFKVLEFEEQEKRYGTLATKKRPSKRQMQKSSNIT